MVSKAEQVWDEKLYAIHSFEIDRSVQDLMAVVSDTDSFVPLLLMPNMMNHRRIRGQSGYAGVAYMSETSTQVGQGMAFGNAFYSAGSGFGSGFAMGQSFSGQKSRHVYEQITVTEISKRTNGTGVIKMQYEDTLYKQHLVMGTGKITSRDIVPSGNQMQVSLVPNKKENATTVSWVAPKIFGMKRGIGFGIYNNYKKRFGEHRAQQCRNIEIYLRTTQNSATAAAAVAANNNANLPAVLPPAPPASSINVNDVGSEATDWTEESVTNPGSTSYDNGGDDGDNDEIVETTTSERVFPDGTKRIKTTTTFSDGSVETTVRTIAPPRNKNKTAAAQQQQVPAQLHTCSLRGNKQEPAAQTQDDDDGWC